MSDHYTAQAITQQLMHNKNRMLDKITSDLYKALLSKINKVFLSYDAVGYNDLTVMEYFECTLPTAELKAKLNELLLAHDLKVADLTIIPPKDLSAAKFGFINGTAYGLSVKPLTEPEDKLTLVASNDIPSNHSAKLK